MKLALIGSATHLSAHPYSTYHLVLAQRKDDEPYMRHYKKRRAQGDFIIVDNGAAELQQSIPFREVLEVANYLDADEIVMPDVLDNMDETLALTWPALSRVPQKMRMMVPQGTDWDEWGQCLRKMVGWGCNTIGIAKRYERLPGGRKHAITLMSDLGILASHHVHLLGVNANPIEEVRAAYPHARGIDTAAPFAFAQQKMLFRDKLHISYEWDDPFDEEIFKRNMWTLHRACYGG